MLESYFDEENLTPEQTVQLALLRSGAETQARIWSQQFKDIKPGDLITVNFPENTNLSQVQIYAMVEQFEKLQKALNVNIMILGDGIGVHHWSEEAMKEYGWIRDPNFIKTTNRSAN